jgi:ribonuclease VapC
LIVVDTSALIAILKDESDAQSLLDRVGQEEEVVIGTPTLFEYLMVAVGKGDGGQEATARALLDQLGVKIVSWTPEQADLATDAFLRFGRGRGHPARLNFGDCMAYAVAKSLDAPLLFKGTDFAATDVKQVKA